MTRQSDFDAMLREWADHGDEHLPDRYLQAALFEISTSTQRGAWRAPLEGVIMRLQPVALFIGVAAVVIAAVAAYVAFAQPNIGGPEPTPSPDAQTRLVQGMFTTTAFEVPFTATLEGGASPDGWTVIETPTMINLTPAPGTDFDVAVLARQASSLITASGTAPLGDDLTSALDGLDGVTAEPMQRPDLEAESTITVGGLDIPIVAAQIQGGANADPILRTDDGREVDRPAATATWWLFDVSRPTGNGILVIYRGSDDPSRWFGAVATFLESLEFGD